MFRFARIFLALILIGALIGGGALLFRAGMAQGYQMGAVSASASALQAQGGTPAPGTSVAPAFPYYAPYMYGPGFYGRWGGGFFNPFGFIGGILVFFFVIFIVGGIFRMVFFRGFGRGGPWMHGRGAWRHGEGGDKGPWSGDVPPFFKEWHERAHQQADKAPEPPSEAQPQA